MFKPTKHNLNMNKFYVKYNLNSNHLFKDCFYYTTCTGEEKNAIPYWNMKFLAFFSKPKLMIRTLTSTSSSIRLSHDLSCSRIFEQSYLLMSTCVVRERSSTSLTLPTVVVPLFAFSSSLLMVTPHSRQPHR